MFGWYLMYLDVMSEVNHLMSWPIFWAQFWPISGCQMRLSIPLEWSKWSLHQCFELKVSSSKHGNGGVKPTIHWCTLTIIIYIDTIFVYLQLWKSTSSHHPWIGLEKMGKNQKTLTSSDQIYGFLHIHVPLQRSIGIPGWCADLEVQPRHKDLTVDGNQTCPVGELPRGFY